MNNPPVSSVAAVNALRNHDRLYLIIDGSGSMSAFHPWWYLKALLGYFEHTGRVQDILYVSQQRVDSHREQHQFVDGSPTDNPNFPRFFQRASDEGALPVFITDYSGEFELDRWAYRSGGEKPLTFYVEDLYKLFLPDNMWAEQSAEG